MSTKQNASIFPTKEGGFSTKVMRLTEVPVMDFCNRSWFDGLPVLEWQSWATSLVFDICGVVSYLWFGPCFPEHVPWENWAEPSGQETSKMCFGLHSVTMKFMQIVFLFSFYYYFAFSCGGGRLIGGNQQGWLWFIIWCWSGFQKKNQKPQQMLVLIHCLLWEFTFYYFSNSVWMQICDSKGKR